MRLPVLILITLHHFACSEPYGRPSYEYRYQTEDVMQSDATSIPVRGYHSVRRDYYPDLDFSHSSGLFRPNYRRFDRHPYTHSDYHRRPYYQPRYYNHVGGGGYNDGQRFSEGGKTYKDDNYEKLHGSHGEHSVEDQAGYNRGNANVKSSKGKSGYHNEEVGKRKSADDGKSYHGSEHVNQEGKQGGQEQEKASHKKGHVVKGFKKSHHKDEDSKTEEYYDEAHNEGGNHKFGEGSGSFGKNSASAYKGGHDEGGYNEVAKKDDGHYDSKHSVVNADGDQGHYNNNKHFEKGESYDARNGGDQHSLLGHQEVSKVYNERPFFPIDK
ncbi:hypothetical protein PPYR_14845 [Photinus pyralis]|uniref:Uncharacterized protein n=2 Tax=Photinus pyralis TaxID=7054 RepID=A0A5N4A080_PHOPY|nr:hypothetical protein PPYR_14845 [Photinus pyralis]